MASNEIVPSGDDLAHVLATMSVETHFHEVIAELCAGKSSRLGLIRVGDLEGRLDSSGTVISESVATGVVRKLKLNDAAAKIDTGRRPEIPTQGAHQPNFFVEKRNCDINGCNMKMVHHPKKQKEDGEMSLPTIHDLLDSVVFHIISFLSTQEVGRLDTTSSFLRSLFRDETGDEIVWKPLAHALANGESKKVPALRFKQKRWKNWCKWLANEKKRAAAAAAVASAASAAAAAATTRSEERRTYTIGGADWPAMTEREYEGTYYLWE